MNAIKQLLVFLTGHRMGAQDKGSAEEYSGLSKIGASIVLAALLCAINIGIFAWVMAADATPLVRALLAALGALFGGILVLVIDRGAVYFTDTLLVARKAAAVIYLCMRVLIILAIGSFSSQAVIPVLFESELKDQALQERESRDDARAVKLNERFALDGKSETHRAKLAASKTAEAAAVTLPPDINQRLVSAKGCWVEHGKRFTALVHSGLEHQQASARLSALAKQCNQNAQSANAERDQYFVQARAALTEARTNAKKAGEDLNEAQTEVNQKIDSAAEIEKAVLNPRSAAVLEALLKTSAAARVKWAVLTFLQIVLELMPLLLKFQAGQSIPGRRVAVQRALVAAALNRVLDDQSQQNALYDTMRELSETTARELAHSPVARQAMADVQLRLLQATVPLDALEQWMANLAQREEKVTVFQQRYPRYAESTSRAWHKAVQEAAAAMAGGVPAGASA